MNASDNISFYKNLKTFKNFTDLFNIDHYVDVPKNWWVLITDIKGSTQAIKDGKYKQVNMLGAACITCVLNQNKNLDLPFVFGGDGATILVPDIHLENILEELNKLQSLAKKSFGLDLRVGAVSLSTSEMKNESLQVAKYELSPGNYISQFRGTALTKAEELVKGNHPSAKIIHYSEGDTDANLQGLSCRIEPVLSKKGEIISLLCRSVGSDADQTMHEIIEKLNVILNNDFKLANPVNIEKVKWKWPHPTLKEEAIFQKKNRPFIIQYFITAFFTFFSNHSLKFNIRLGTFLPSKYKPELVLNCDFKKYDETLRMVIDCEPSQVLKIKSLLEEYSQQNKIAYGLHHSKEALITCMVFSPTQNKHTHFIDGANGGYAMAAIEFKQRLKKLADY